MKSWFFVLALSLVSVEVALAEGEEAPAVTESPAVVEMPVAAPVKRQGNRTRDKETEGTQAPNRFEGDPVIKSRYEYNGQSLEVDPD